MRPRDLAFVLVLWMIVLLGFVGGNLAVVGAQSPNRVGLVVRFDDGSVITRCVEFGEAEISGYEVLMRSGLQVVAVPSGGMGITICRIEDEGCPANNCFCKCSGSTCAYWSYWHLAGEEWSYSFAGADSYRVHSGDVEGWTWGKGEPPPTVSLEQICASPATATMSPTATPAVPTALPTSTSQLAQTFTPLPTTTMTRTLGPPTKTPTQPPAATATETATMLPPTSTVSPTPVSQSDSDRPVESFATPTKELAALSSPTLGQWEVTSMPVEGEGQATSNYALFGVLVAVLIGVIAAILIQRRR